MSFFSKLFSRTTQVKPEWLLPDGVLIYAIGDIHGRMDLLTQLMVKIETDLASRTHYTQAYLIPLGDYIDRGFQSAQVIEYFATFSHPILELIPLVGNHELMMAQFMDEPETGALWLSVGGLAALHSYDIKLDGTGSTESMHTAAKALKEKMPDHHQKFLEKLKLSWQSGDYFFVHAGIRPNVAIDDQRPDDLVGIRQEFTMSKVDHGLCVVHGHTGVEDVLIADNRIALDTGAFATGKLSCAVMSGSKVEILAT